MRGALEVFKGERRETEEEEDDDEDVAEDDDRRWRESVGTAS